MSEIGKYLRRAKASQRAGFGLPIIDSREEAVRVVREAAAQMEAMAAPQRLSLLCDLKILSDMLAGRIDHLDRELVETGEKLKQIRISRRAIRTYAQVASAPYRSSARH